MVERTNSTYEVVINPAMPHPAIRGRGELQLGDKCLKKPGLVSVQPLPWTVVGVQDEGLPCLGLAIPGQF